MTERKMSFSPFRLIELVIAVFVGGISNKLFDIYWTIPDLQSRITISVMIVLTIFGLASLFYSVVWLTQYPFRLRQTKMLQSTDKQEQNELPNSIKLRNEFKHRKFELD